MQYASVQVEFLGSQWGIMSVYKYYTNDAEPSKSDAIVYFSNTSPAIPSGVSLTLSSPPRKVNVETLSLQQVV